jgi:hypothetical protein
MRIENLKLKGNIATYDYDGRPYKMEITRHMLSISNDNFTSNHINKAKIREIKNTIATYHKIAAIILPTLDEVKLGAEIKRQETLQKKKWNAYYRILNYLINKVISFNFKF